MSFTFHFEPENHSIHITRVLNADRELVWAAFTQPEYLAQWWGSPGVPIEVVRHELRPQGIFLYTSPMMGQQVWGKFEYVRIDAPVELEYISAFSNEQGETVRAPFSALFPLRVSNHLTFEEQDGNTLLTITGRPLDATEEELHFFAAMASSMQQGFEGSMQQLADFLAKVQA